MSAKKKAQDVKTVPVIALESYTDSAGVWHPYGQEFRHEEGSELEKQRAAGNLRIDDRNAAFPRTTPPPPAEATDGVAETE